MPALLTLEVRHGPRGRAVRLIAGDQKPGGKGMGPARRPPGPALFLEGGALLDAAGPDGAAGEDSAAVPGPRPGLKAGCQRQRKTLPRPRSPPDGWTPGPALGHA